MEKENYTQSSHKIGRCIVNISVENNLWHLVIRIKDRNAFPSFREVMDARRKLLPDDVLMAQFYPSIKQRVNIEPFTHHLWEVRQLKMHKKETSK